MPTIKDLRKVKKIEGKNYVVRGAIGIYIEKENDSGFDVALMLPSKEHKGSWNSYYKVKVKYNEIDFVLWEIYNPLKRKWVKLSLGSLKITKTSDLKVCDQLFILSYCSYKNKDGFVLLLEKYSGFINNEYVIKDLTNELNKGSLSKYKPIELKIELDSFTFTLNVYLENYICKFA